MSLTKFALADDTQGMLGLVLSGRAKLVKSGTEALVLSRSFALTEVRVQDGTVTGWSGWIAMEHVRR